MQDSAINGLYSIATTAATNIGTVSGGMTIQTAINASAADATSVRFTPRALFDDDAGSRLNAADDGTQRAAGDERARKSLRVIGGDGDQQAARGLRIGEQ